MVDHRFAKAKYILIQWNNDNYEAYAIENDAELETWKNDGSMHDGDILIEVKSVHDVTVTTKEIVKIK
mgnify:CR=1 FL=1